MKIGLKAYWSIAARIRQDLILRPKPLSYGPFRSFSRFIKIGENQSNKTFTHRFMCSPPNLIPSQPSIPSDTRHSHSPHSIQISIQPVWYSGNISYLQQYHFITIRTDRRLMKILVIDSRVLFLWCTLFHRIIISVTYVTIFDDTFFLVLFYNSIFCISTESLKRMCFSFFQNIWASCSDNHWYMIP